MNTPERGQKKGKTEPASKSELANRLPHGHISLKEWNTLLAVVRHDGFARAAEALHISQPAISYTIAKIEERLGISLLRQDGRRARITVIGQQLLMHVEPLVQQAVQVEAIARQLRENWRPEIRIAVVEEFPCQLLVSAIRSFSGATVLVTEGTADFVQELLHKRQAELAIVRQLANSMRGEPLIETDFVPVAHPGHPLFKIKRPLAEADLQQVVEISIEAAGSTLQRWHVSNFDTAEKALAERIGYGWLPRHQVQDALAAGRLAILPLASYPRRSLRFYLASLASRPVSDEAGRLMAALHHAAQ